MRTGELVSEQAMLEWLSYAVNNGMAYLENQRAWNDVNLGMDIINGDWFVNQSSELSNVATNRTKRQVREMVASLGNLRIQSRYKTNNRNFVDRVEVYDKLFTGWWSETGADFAWKECLKYATACGTGYLVPRWDNDFHGPGQGDIRLDWYGPRDILVVQIPRSHDIQKAYAVGIRKETPLDLARRTWPEHASRIVADRESPAGFKKAVSAVARYASAVLNRFGWGAFNQEESTPFPVVDIWEWYIVDSSINTSGREIALGEPGSSWAYVVPFLGQKIPGRTPGDFREAGGLDALMFPNRRCFIATKTCRLSDGPNPYHHGKAPVIQMRVDDWPWNFLGYSMCREGASIEESNVSMMRDIVDANRARLNPPFGYDSDRMTEDAAAQINPRIPGQSIPFQMGGLAALDTVFKPLVNPAMYDVPPVILEFIKSQEARQDYQMGVSDVAALVKAKQLPASDGLEKLLQSMGALGEDISRNQEGCMNKLGPFIKSMQLQFYPPAQVIAMIGEDLVAKVKEFSDGEPGNLIPSHLPGEDTLKPSPTPMWKRAKWFDNQFTFQLHPNSLHKLQQTSRKLSIAVLQKQGFPIDPWTLADLNDIPDFGPAPEGATTIWQRWVEWERLQAQNQAMIQQYMQQLGIAPPQGGPGQGRGGGRPNSFATAPALQTKEGGRATVRTSAR
jgi:hypothetical protein